MSENENKNSTQQVSFDPAPGTDFLREKIKQKPLNKKRLVRRTLLNVLTAVIFGTVACLTFLFLEPIISERINPGKDMAGTETPTEIKLPDSDEVDEISPEDMYATDTEMLEEVLQGNVQDVNQNIQNIEQMVNSIEFGLNDYQNLYSQLRTLADKVSHSLVTITGVISEDGPWDNLYQDSARTSGVIVADNGLALLILVEDTGLSEADELTAHFFDGSKARCSIVGHDAATSLMILSVPHATLYPETLEKAVPASFGTSRSSTLKGTPVMALGSPTGVNDSMVYGMITSGTEQLSYTDSDYSLISTDIQGAAGASGVLVSLRGNVIGFIYDGTEENEINTRGMLTALGITEVKPLIEQLSNSQYRAYLGIKGMDITYDMKKTYGLPDGVYIQTVEMDSPALEYGLQNGDIIQKIDGTQINTYHDLILWLSAAKPGTQVEFHVLRQSVDDYIQLNIDVMLGEISNRE